MLLCPLGTASLLWQISMSSCFRHALSWLAYCTPFILHSSIAGVVRLLTALVIVSRGGDVQDGLWVPLMSLLVPLIHRWLFINECLSCPDLVDVCTVFSQLIGQCSVQCSGIRVHTDTAVTSWDVEGEWGRALIFICLHLSQKHSYIRKRNQI